VLGCVDISQFVSLSCQTSLQCMGSFAKLLVAFSVWHWIAVFYNMHACVCIYRVPFSLL